MMILSNWVDKTQLQVQLKGLNCIWPITFEHLQIQLSFKSDVCEC